MAEKMRVERRTAMKLAAATAAASVVPRSALGGPKFVAPSEKIIVGFIGCGTQGFRQLMPALAKHPSVHIVAVCDPNRKSDDYPEWSRHELNEKIRKFLDDPNWAKDARGGLCGREVGQEIVTRHYAKQKPLGQGERVPRLRRLPRNARQGKGPRRGLHHDARPPARHDRRARDAAGQARDHAQADRQRAPRGARSSATRRRRPAWPRTCFCAADRRPRRRSREWIAAGAIGPVREVHNWSTRPFWPQGMTELPPETPPVPDGLDWDLWLGPGRRSAVSPGLHARRVPRLVRFRHRRAGRHGPLQLLPDLPDPEARLAG